VDVSGLNVSFSIAILSGSLCHEGTYALASSAGAADKLHRSFTSFRMTKYVWLMNSPLCHCAPLSP